MQDILILFLGILFLSLFVKILSLESKHYSSDKILRIILIGFNPIYKLLPKKEMPWAEIALLLMKAGILIMGVGSTGVGISSIFK